MLNILKKKTDLSSWTKLPWVKKSCLTSISWIKSSPSPKESTCRSSISWDLFTLDCSLKKNNFSGEGSG